MTTISTVTRTISGSKPVHVRQYQRFRNGAWEDVCQHQRSLPR
jgi:hypothetical protein